MCIRDSIRLIRERDASDWYDLRSTPATETRTDLIRLAWDRSGTDLPWAEYKSTDILHLLPSIEPFAMLDVENGGYRHIVNATSERQGPSWRMVVELTDPPTGWGVYPGGQTGNPGSNGYDAFIETWEQGGYYDLHWMTTADALPEAGGWTLTLEPAAP